MRRVVVVDDEILVRIGIRSLLDDGEAGYSVVGEAAGGIEGASVVARLDPDIVLTDLVMAEGDGLELIRRLRADNQGVAIIVLSCRNDFELVREAMRAGADDYVFKLSLKTPELLESFSRALGKRTGSTGRLAGPDGGSACAPAGFAAAVLTLMRGEALFAFADPAFERPYRILFLEFDPAEGSGGDPALAQLVRELARADCRIIGSAVSGRRALLALKNEGRGAAAEVFVLAEEFGGRYLGRRPRGGLSRLAGHPSELAGAFHEARGAVRAAFRYGPPLFFADDAVAGATRSGARGDCGEESVFSPETYAAACVRIRRSVEALDTRSALADLGAVFSLLRSAADKDADRLASLAIDAFSPFKERARSLGFELEKKQDAGEGIESPDDMVRSARTLGDIEGKLPSFVEAFCREAAARAGLRREVAEVRRWVLSDLARQYTVEEAADRAGMSPSHFAHIFKKEIGVSFIDFVNRSRMERARELLLTTDLLVRQIADAVGVESPNHFGLLFRRVFGVTPNELRGR